MSDKTLSQKIVEKLAPVLPKQPDRTPPPPVVNPSHTIYRDGLTWAKLPIAGDQKRIDALDAEWKALEKKLEPFGHDDALKSWKADVQRCLDGELPPDELRTKQEWIRRNADTRNVIKHQMSQVSLKACILCADILEEFRDKHLPGYVQHLLKAESEVSPAVGELGKTPLQLTVAALPKFITQQVERLRDPLPMRRPSTILTLK